MIGLYICLGALGYLTVAGVVAGVWEEKAYTGGDDIPPGLVGAVWPLTLVAALAALPFAVAWTASQSCIQRRDERKRLPKATATELER